MPEILQWTEEGGPLERWDELAREEPLEIQVETKPVSVTMRTPGHDEELAAGFLVSEGLIRQRTDITAISPYWRNPSGNVIGVFLREGLELDWRRLTRHVFASSSCGLCGKATIDAVQQQFEPISSSIEFPAGKLVRMLEALSAAQVEFLRTGGVHAAGIFTAEGEPVVVREDVGRHNAVDKVIGFGLLNGLLPYDRHVLLVSGRASFEIMQKALAARIALVAAVSAPSSLAVEFAEASGQSLVAFLRGSRMNIYTHRERLGLEVRPTQPIPALRP